MNKLLTLLSIAALTLSAATFNVSTTPELRTALSTAATNGEDDTIILADGTYKTTDDGEGTFIYLSNESNSLTLQGTSAESVILSGEGKERVLKIQSTRYNSNLYLSNISINKGYSTESGGAALYFQMRSVIITNSSFNDNNSTKCGGAITYNTDGIHILNISSSEFINNTSSSSSGGGAICNPWDTYDSLVIDKVKFINNKTNGAGGAILFSSYYTSAVISNSVFIDNNASIGGAIYIGRTADNTKIINSLFISNPNTLSYYENSNHKIFNSIFSSEDNIINNQVSALAEVHNSYINENNVTMTIFKSNNIFEGVNLGFTDEASGDYRLTSSSDLIDAGTTDIVGITLPTTDLDGNSRISGATVDIGPYEFSSTRPTINSFSYTGTAKEHSELTFSVDYTLSDERTIDTVEYDYNNDETYTTTNTYTFTAAGTYTVGVKVKDSEGEYSTSTISVTVAALSFDEMTDEQKLVKAIDPQYYDAIISIITSKEDASNTSGYTLGEYDGKQYVQDNLEEFGLIEQSALALSSDDVNNLSKGWSLISTKADITDLTIFNSATIIWTYNNASASWSAWSSNSETQQKIQDSSTVDLITTIPANSGIWVQK